MGYQREHVQLALEHLIANQEVVNLEGIIEALNKLTEIHAEGAKGTNSESAVVPREDAGAVAAGTGAGAREAEV